MMLYMQKCLKPQTYKFIQFITVKGFRILVHFVSAVINRSKLGQHTENTMPIFVCVFFLHLLRPETRCPQQRCPIHRNISYHLSGFFCGSLELSNMSKLHSIG